MLCVVFRSIRPSDQVKGTYFFLFNSCCVTRCFCTYAVVTLSHHCRDVRRNIRTDHVCHFCVYL